MTRSLFLALALFLVFCVKTFANSVGVSTYPLDLTSKGMVTTEFVNYWATEDSANSGPGMQVRYLKKLNSVVSVDGGVGFSDSEFNRRFFAAADVELLSDYGNQPRVSARPFLQRVQENRATKTLLGVGPVVSKGFNVYGKEVYPFVGLPMSLVLRSSNSSYDFRTMLALGASGKLPFKDMENIILNVEQDINVSNGYSAFYLGATFPIN